MRYALFGIALLCFLVPLKGQQYDIVLAHGRVMDPASNLDAVRSIGIRGDKVAAISATALEGKTVVDVKGLVIAPGFIDLHSHGQTPENYRYKARDGVTTALELEVGAYPVGSWLEEREGKALINFGATSGHIPAHMLIQHDSGTLLPRDHAANEVLTPEQRLQVLALIRKGLEEGGLGIGLGITYVKAPRDEILDVFKLAAERKVPVFVHMRNSGPVEPGAIDSTQEVLADALATGASLHIVHLTSTALGDTPVCLGMIQGARKRGLDVTTEAYPYTAGMTDLSSNVFAPGWEDRLGGISYGDLQWAATGERLTAESFARYRKQGGMVAVHGIPEEMVKLAMADPMVMIGSDGILQDGKGHPRAAGTYSRVLGRYVREQHVLSLMDAIRKMTVMPADRIGMNNKGRIAVGADADITVFDPEHIEDRATFDKPAQYSVGVQYVLVNGTFAVKDGEIQDGVNPGRPVVRR